MSRDPRTPEDGKDGSKAMDGQPLTLLLRRFTKGDPEVGAAVMRIIGKELRRIAARQMRRERKDHTLQPTALVNEAYLRLMGAEGDPWRDRKHFFEVAASLMRQILVDHARSRKALKRRGQIVELDTNMVWVGPVQPEILDIDRALTELAVFAPRQARLVELHFFGGLSLDESASILEIAARTADKDWALARGWLRKRLKSPLGERT